MQFRIQFLTFIGTVKNGTLYMFGGSMLLKQNNTVQEVPSMILY